MATGVSSREQLAIAEFAEALLVIPKTLAVNAAQDATDLVARLRAYHNTSQLPDSGKVRRGGVVCAGEGCGVCRRGVWCVQEGGVVCEERASMLQRVCYREDARESK
jgi:hypothetical protein